MAKKCDNFLIFFPAIVMIFLPAIFYYTSVIFELYFNRGAARQGTPVCTCEARAN